MFFSIEKDITNKIMNWDGKDIESFSKQFSTDDYLNMGYFSMNEGMGMVDVDDESKCENDTQKAYLLNEFLKECIVVAIFGDQFDEEVNQKEVVKKFYNLWSMQNL